MRKLIIFLMGTVLITACNKDKEVDINYEVTIKIDVLDVVKNLKDIDNSDLFPNGTISANDGKARITTLFYDDSGILLSDNVQLINSFADIVTISMPFEGGKYSIITIVDIVGCTDNTVNFEIWKIENVNLLRDLKVEDLRSSASSDEYKALGINNSTLDIQKSEDILIKVQPAGSLVTFHFTMINNSQTAYLWYAWNKRSDYLLVSENKCNIISGVFSSEYKTDEQYSGFYGYRYFLPNNQIGFLWESYDAAIKLVKTNSIVYDVAAGVNKTITINTDSGQTMESMTNKSATVNTSSVLIGNASSDNKTIKGSVNSTLKESSNEITFK